MRPQKTTSLLNRFRVASRDTITPIFELTVNEVLTFILGLGGLVVSVVGLLNSLDTRDLREAVSDLATLSESTGREADSAQGQLLALQRDQIGWISPEHLTINGDIVDHPNGPSEIDMAITYENIGKSPSFRTQAAALITEIDLPPNSFVLINANAGNMLTSESDECSKLALSSSAISDTKRYVVWPGIKGPYFHNISAFVSPADANQIRSGYRTFRVNGCFTYESESGEHHSWFCMILTPDLNKRLSEWHSIDCLEGNGAD